MHQWLSGRRALVVLAAAACLGLAGPSRAVEAKPSLAEPSLAPDGTEIAFASGGDIWTVPAQGGVAHLLVTDPATESRPVYSPDGQSIAFMSTRGGSANIYVLKLATGEVTRLTWSDANEQLDGWSRDGKWLYFSSPANDVGRQGDIFRVSVAGGTPLEVSRERYLNEFSSAPSPDGRSVAFIAKGLASAQWWRKGHAHIDENEIWLKPIAEPGGYRRLASVGAKHQWPMWRPDGQGLWFMSDASGAENLWTLDLAGGEPKPVTSFKAGRLLWPSVAYDGSAIVFERGFEIWKLDTRTGRAAAVPITLRGAPAAAGERHLTESNFRSMALSPDGKKVAVIAHGEVFAAPAKDGGPAQRITETVGAERDLAWSPDSRRLAFVSERGLGAAVVEYDFTAAKSHDLTAAGGLVEAPVYSPDGKMVAYVRDGRELHVLTRSDGGASGKDVVVFTGALDRGGGVAANWSPDSRWLAFPVTDHKSFRNVHVVEATGGPDHAVSFLANGNVGDQVAWSPDGKYLIFDSNQRSEDTHLVRVDLLPHTPKYREDAFRELFKPADAPERKPPASTPEATAAAPAAPAKTDKPAEDSPPKKLKVAPVEIVFEGIRARATYLPLGLSAEQPVISPDGKTLVFRAHLGGQDSLYSYSLDELAREAPVPQQITAGRRTKHDIAVTPDSKEVYYLDGGTVSASPIEAPRSRAVAITAEMTTDFDREKLVVFDEAWETLNRRFFDPKFNGVDWAELRKQWAPYVAGARTSDELRRDINLMIGELNASHSGINRPAEGFGAAPAPRIGDLGLRFEREPFEAGQGLVVREVVALGPAALAGVRAGDRLLAVEGHAIGPHTNLDSLLADRIGARVTLSLGAPGKPPREAVVRPVAWTVAQGLAYRQWVDDRRAYVETISGGRLGYVHIADMSEDSLRQLYIDLDAQNEERAGVVIDLRNNNGGFVNGYVLDVFARRNFLNMTPRDLFAVPSRQALGQRALGSPTILVVNESSLSDAEDFTEGYRALGIGRIVGVPTAGWIIYTGPQTLVDGSVLRVPSVRIQDAHGGDLEMHPRPVDVTVERSLGETATGKDAQLETAVAELLKTVGAGR